MNRALITLLVIVFFAICCSDAMAQSVIAKNRCKVGKNLLENGRYAEAEKELKESLRLDPAYGDAHYLLGLTYYCQKKLDDAQKELTEVIRLEPRFLTSRLYLATIFLEKKQYSKAREQLDYVIAQDSKTAQAHYGLGVVCYCEGDLNKSIAQWRKAIEIDKNFVPAYYNLGLALFLSGNREDGISFVEKAMKMRPQNPLYGFTVAWLEYDSGKKKEAVSRFEGYAEGCKGTAIGLVSEGMCAYEKGEYEKALDCAEKAVEKDRELQKAYELSGMSNEALKSWDKALKRYEELMALDPNERDIKKKIETVKEKMKAEQADKAEKAEQNNYPYHEQPTTYDEEQDKHSAR